MTYAELKDLIANMSHFHKHQKVMVRDKNGEYFSIEKLRTPVIDILDRGYVYLQGE
tara:strand:- start:1181 stop:1348 length:168 start_codon:yes stop_codon:yes gene_type:complete